MRAIESAHDSRSKPGALRRIHHVIVFKHEHHESLERRDRVSILGVRVRLSLVVDFRQVRVRLQIPLIRRVRARIPEILRLHHPSPHQRVRTRRTRRLVHRSTRRARWFAPAPRQRVHARVLPAQRHQRLRPQLPSAPLHHPSHELSTLAQPEGVKSTRPSHRVVRSQQLARGVHLLADVPDVPGPSIPARRRREHERAHARSRGHERARYRSRETVQRVARVPHAVPDDDHRFARAVAGPVGVAPRVHRARTRGRRRAEGERTRRERRDERDERATTSARRHGARE